MNEEELGNRKALKNNREEELGKEWWRESKGEKCQNVKWVD